MNVRTLRKRRLEQRMLKILYKAYDMGEDEINDAIDFVKEEFKKIINEGLIYKWSLDIRDDTDDFVLKYKSHKFRSEKSHKVNLRPCDDYSALDEL